MDEYLKERIGLQEKLLKNMKNAKQVIKETESRKLEEQTRICVEMAETIQKEHKNIRGYEKEALMNVEGRLTDIKVKIWGLQNKLSRRS